MAPNVDVSNYRTGVLFDTEDTPDYVEVITKEKQAKQEKAKSNRELQPIYWSNVYWFTVMHVMALYGLKLVFTDAKLLTTAWAVFLYVIGTLGVSAGVHRLWSHKAYKARLPLRMLLTFFNTIAFQNSIWEWTRDHRVHHKFTETDADPVNADRGFFFAHVGWLLCKKHPDVTRIGKTVDLSDIEADPCVAFQKKYYGPLVFTFCFLMPTVVPALWGESLWNAYFVAAMLRYTLSLHGTWLVNSLAHYHGDRPYDKSIAARENIIVSLGALGEGYHNYHHVFPWDYKTAELGVYSTNLTTAFIDFMARIGQAYDLKYVNQEMIKTRTLRTGDGTHPVWGWDDKDLTQEDKDLAKHD
ncbi:Acyl-CoA Delta(11) desaturase [Frankliniella fusca]|uniref:Acyl-CoA Delta(11) desaturase n=1 Tax=Frankliniella fusca TaxID=407009 RepID=A0AAE1HCZ8_9NEOP|nr:Acyl-CoA Delta(11) desaturase [Frankliniella fusca]